MCLRTAIPFIAATIVRRRVVLGLLVAMMCGAGTVAAQDGALFQPIEPVAVDSVDKTGGPALSATTRVPTRGGETVRHREVRLDFARLDAVKDTIESGSPATLDLNLFDDVVLKAVDLRIARTSTGGYSLAGKLEEMHLGTAVLVVSGQIVKGSVRTPSATYTIDAMDGVCHIRKVDSSTLPPLGEPLRPPPPVLSPTGKSEPGWTSANGAGTAHDEDGSVTDVLVVYTPAVREARGGVLAVIAEVQLFVAETNQAYDDSGVDQEVFLRRVEEVDYTESGDSSLDLGRLRNPSDGHMDIVHELREKTGSDLVHLIADVSDVCGIAYLMYQVAPWFHSFGFGLTDHNCGGDTFAHELGHNMGLRHDRYVDSGNTPYPYSHGYVNQAAFEEGATPESRWRTIMAYNNQCSDADFGCNTLLRFSNADQEHEGDPLGVGEGADAADARRSLNDTRQLVADFRRAGPDLTASLLWVLVPREWQPGQTVTLQGVVTNDGRIEAAGTMATFYRSTDSTISDEDTALTSVAVGALVANDSATPSYQETAPDPGGYYYGICVDAVDGETDSDNCSPGYYVAVGPTVSIAGDAQVSEGESLSFSVTLSEARDTAVDVEWELVRETAVAGIDYTDVGGTVTVPANQTSVFISVDTIADDIPEHNDTLTLKLLGTTPAPPAGVVLAVDGIEATGTINNDDGDEPRFADAGLKEAVLAALNKPNGGDVTVEELASLGTLDARAKEIDSLSGLEAATGLRELTLYDNEVRDLTPLGHLGDLYWLGLDRNGFDGVAGLAPLKGLSSLSLTGNPVDDVTPLVELSGLTRLWLDLTDVTDLTPLADLKSLEMLFLDKNQATDADEAGITDISSLAALTNLTDLNLNFNDLVDISALSGMTRLNYLDLWGNEIEDVSPLRELEALFWVDLDDNMITDVAPLAGLTGLESLHLNGNRIENVAPLSGLGGLETLGLNGNGISDLGPLAGLTGLRFIWLGENAVSDISALGSLTQLRFLDLGNNAITNISTLAELIRLRELHLQGNRIRDIGPLEGLRQLLYLDLSNNDIRDIEPLVSNSRLGDDDEVYIHGNPLNETSINVHVPALIERGVDLTYIGVSVAAASALEGGEMEFIVRLSAAAAEDVTVNWAASDVSATAGDDYPTGQSGLLTIAADSLETTFSVPTNDDAQGESHELIEITLSAAGVLPAHVGLSGASGLGLIVDPSGPTQHVPLFASASDETRQGFLRVINRSGRNAVHIVAADDMGNRHTTTLAMGAGGTVHFNSNDLENGNVGKGLTRGIGEGDADWRLELSGNNVDVLTYMRTNDGFLTSLHDVVPSGSVGYSVPIFNPGRNINQESLLRLVNPGAADAAVTISGADDRGDESDEVGLELAPGEARTLSAGDLENGTGLDGAMGTGTGKWQLLVKADQPILVSSLMQTPTDHLTNLSTVPNNRVTVGEETIHHVYLFPSASDPDARQGFVRVINRDDPGSVQIKAYDDSDDDYPAVSLALDRDQSVHLNSDDLEVGNEDKGLSSGIGAGEGDWRLEVTSEIDIDVLAYVRRTEDGFLTSIHDTVPLMDGVYRVPIFNPGSNRNQVSRLRLVNAGENQAEVTITGEDDTGRISSGTVRLSIPAGTVRTVTAQALEAGAEDISGALGDGVGKWSLDVRSDEPIYVLNLLQSPTGHLTNLSTTP